MFRPRRSTSVPVPLLVRLVPMTFGFALGVAFGMWANTSGLDPARIAIVALVCVIFTAAFALSVFDIWRAGRS